MFICATSLVENNALFPSYFFVGWTLVAILYWRQNQPDSWYRSIGFLESLWPLLTGTELKLAHNIKPDKKNQESIDEFNAVWERRYESARANKEKLNKRAQKERDEVAEEMKGYGHYSGLATRKKKS